MANAVAKRRGQFAFGRACARAALGKHVAIAMGERGMPMWPAGYAGSITHTADRAAAAVVQGGGIGIDLELLADIRSFPELVDRVALPSERDLPAAVVFSAKESVYKCVYPTLRRFLEFTDVELEVAGDRFRVIRGVDGLAVCGRFAVTAAYVATAAWLGE